MAITVEARTSLIELVVGMFGAAPGAKVLSDLVAAYEKGQTIKQIAANLANTIEFATLFPTFLTNAEFATKVVNQLVGTEVVAAEKALAVTELTARLNAGASRSNVFVDAIDALDAITSTNAAWANAGAALDNKVAAAVYYSVDKQLSPASLSAAQNVISGVTSVASTVTTANAASDGTASAGGTFLLTAGVDNFLGGAANDTFIADNSGTNTTGLADVLNGGAGVDSLTIYGFATADGVPQISNIENIVLDNTAAGGTISLATATGVSSVTVQAALGATDTTVASGVTVTLRSNVDKATAQVVDFGATATAASLVLDGVATNTLVDVEAQGAAVKTLNIATSGAASTVGQLEVDTKMATVVITGAQNLTITDAVEEAVEVINASAFTGKLSVATANQATTPDALVSNVDVLDLTITGGTGNDTINIAANAADNEVSVNAGAGDDKVVIATGVAFTAATSILAGDSIVGGDGTDTLSINGNVTAANLSALITGFEILEFTADASGTDMSVNKLAITQFTAGDTIDVTLTGLAAASSVTLSGAGSGGDASTLTATIGTDTTADALNVILESTGGTTGSELALTNYDTLSLSSTKATTDAATVTNTLASIASSATAALNISGTQDLTITTAGLKAAAAVISTSTGAVTSTFTTSLKSYTGGTGADTLSVLAGDLKQGNTFAGGAGTDKLTVTASASQDMGIVGLTGFETLSLTTAGANVGDLRNVTDLATISVTAGAGTDNLTLNRLSGDTTLSFATSIDQVVTTLNAGTSQKVAFSAAATVTNITLDSGTTSLTVTSDNGNVTADEAVGVFTDIDGTSLASIIVLGKDRTNLGTLEATTTSVDASGATGGLTVTASATKTSIIGSQAADTITGGGAADTIQGGKGADTLSGGAGADTYVFAATGALNGADVLTIVAADDILNFSAFLAGGSVDVNLATGTAINEYTIANTSDVAIANKVVMYSDADATLIDDASEIALLIQGAGDAFSLASGGKSIVITGDAGSADDVARIWFIDDSLDGTLGTIGTADVVLVGVTAAGFDVDTLLNTKFTF